MRERDELNASAKGGSDGCKILRPQFNHFPVIDELVGNTTIDMTHEQIFPNE